MPDLNDIEFRIDAVERTLKNLRWHVEASNARGSIGTAELTRLRDQVDALKHAIANGASQRAPRAATA
jgi:hypothetical protein